MQDKDNEGSLNRTSGFDGEIAHNNDENTNNNLADNNNHMELINFLKPNYVQSLLEPSNQVNLMFDDDTDGFFRGQYNKNGHHRRNSSKNDSPFIGARQRCSSNYMQERNNGDMDMYYES